MSSCSNPFHSALGGASKHGDEKLVDRLLNFGVLPTSADLAVACGEKGDVDIVRRILDSEPDKKKKKLLAMGEKGSNTTPLHEAARHNHFEICEILVSVGANPTLPDKFFIR